MKNGNNVVALIPEWEFEKLNLKAFRFKVSNGYLINPKDLTSTNPGMFSIEVFKMGGIVLSEADAIQLRNSEITKPLFTPPVVEEVIVEDNEDTEDIEDTELPQEPEYIKDSEGIQVITDSNDNTILEVESEDKVTDEVQDKELDNEIITIKEEEEV